MGDVTDCFACVNLLIWQSTSYCTYCDVCYMYSTIFTTRKRREEQCSAPCFGAALQHNITELILLRDIGVVCDVKNQSLNLMGQTGKCQCIACPSSWLTESLSPLNSPPPVLVSWWKELLERAVDCGREKECCTNLVRILLHQLPHFVGTAVCCLNDQPAGIVLLCGLRQQLLQH